METGFCPLTYVPLRLRFQISEFYHPSRCSSFVLHQNDVDIQKGTSEIHVFWNAPAKFVIWFVLSPGIICMKESPAPIIHFLIKFLGQVGSFE